MRKGHGSSKVPNVKLRPAPPKASTSKASANSKKKPAADLSDDEQAPSSSGGKPFTGVILTLTGVPEKTEISKLAYALGAMISLHLTDRTTHLIAHGHGSAKYRVALERKIPIMSVDWVKECHVRWLSGENIGLEESIIQYRLPIFNSLVISLTWMDESKRREEISAGIKSWGGVYVKDVGRKPRITHLLCGGDGAGDSEKLTWSKKQNATGATPKTNPDSPEIWIVWEEWYWDCVEFGGRWPEEDYLITKPKPKRKIFVPPSTTSLHQGSMQKTPQILSHKSTLDLCAPPTAADQITVSSSRLARVGSQKVLEEIIKSRKDWKVEDGRVGRNNDSNLDAIAELPENTGQQSGTSELSEELKPALHRLAQRASSFQNLSTEGSKSEGPSRRTPFQRIVSRNFDSRADSSEDKPGGEAFFAGKTFVLLGEANAPQVVSRILSVGGAICSNTAPIQPADVDFVIVRLSGGGQVYNKVSLDIQAKIRTECWLERCFNTCTIWNVEDHPLFIPITLSVPRAPRKRPLVINWSGLDAEQVMWVKRVISALQLLNPPKFSPQSTHLICPSRTGVKYDKALEWGIEVVDINWIWNLARNGLPSENSEEPKYLGHSPDPLDKGKASAKTNDIPITDITNDASLQQDIAPRNPFAVSPSWSSRKKRRIDCETDVELGDIFFGSPKFVLGDPSNSNATIPIKRARSESEAILGLNSAPVISSPSRRHTDSGLFPLSDQCQHNVNGSPQRQIVPSSVSASPATPANTSIENLDRSRTSSLLSRPSSRSTAASRELQNTISELLNLSNKDRDAQQERGVSEGPSHATDNIQFKGTRRPRPTRVRSRNGLGSSPGSALQEKHLQGHASSASFDVPSLPNIEESVNASFVGAGGEENESMRITYQDPGQEEELKRLRRLFPTPLTSKAIDQKLNSGKSSII